MTEDKIRARIAELTQRRDEFVAQANREVQTINAIIAELQTIIGDEPDEPEPEGQEREPELDK